MKADRVKVIVLVAALVMVAGCGKHEPKVYTDAQGVTHIDRLDPGQLVEIPFSGRDSAVVQIARSWNAYALRHARTHRRFIPLYHRYGTQWLAWLADGRPNEKGS